MARKRYSDEDVLRLLREIGLNLALGHDVGLALKKWGDFLIVSLTTGGYYNQIRTGYSGRNLDGKRFA